MLGFEYIYQWQAITEHDKFTHGYIIANSKNLVIEKLLQKNITPYSLKNRQRVRYSIKETTYLIHFTQQIATLLNAGISLLQSLTLLQQECHLLLWRTVLSDIIEKLQLGESYSKALLYHPKLFSSFYIQLIIVGEIVGKLDHCCNLIAVNIIERKALALNIKKSLRYPVTVFAVSILITIFMLIFVIPQFQDIYSAFNSELPLITRIFISLSQQLSHYFIHILILIMLILITYHQLNNKNPGFRKWYARLLLSIPFLKDIIIAKQLCYLFSTLAMTQQSGLVLLRGIECVSQSLSHPLYIEALNNIRNKLLEGKAFSEIINKNTLFPPLCYQFIVIGESSGQLDIFFLNIANWYKQLTEIKINLLLRYLEPTLFTLVAGIVVLLLLAIYLPIFQLGEILI